VRWRSQRRHLSQLLVAEKNRRAQLSQPAVLALSRKLISQMQKQIDSLDLLINKLIDESAELSGKAKKLTADAVEVRDSVPYDPINPLKITVALKAWLIQVWLRPAKRDSRVPTAPFWAFL
jgi:hypothetical protein